MPTDRVSISPGEPGERARASSGSSETRPYEGCYGCGLANAYGLRLRFERVDDTIQTEFTSDERHQGYPGLLHGGILYSLLDETMGQAGSLRRTWIMTGRLEIRYLVPVPIGRRLLIVSRILRQRGRAFEVCGEARFEDGTAVARASGLFMQIPDDLLHRVSASAADDVDGPRTTDRGRQTTEDER